MVFLDGMHERYAVIALGGNAILRKNQIADPATQMANLRVALANLACVLDYYKSFALTHGNGPQVGNDMIRSHWGFRAGNIPELKLTDCSANTQGRIGHWIIKEMKNHPRFVNLPTACIVTHVYVEKNTFTTEEYVKGIGPWLPNTDENRRDFEKRNIIYRTSPDNKEIRRVVPSPNPYEIEEYPIIAKLIQSGVITICCGGGGIPVFDPCRSGMSAEQKSDCFQQCEVVIDKDRVSGLLACKLLSSFDGAEVDLFILSDTNGLYRTAECRSEDFISQMTLDELDVFINQSKLDPGTILPKLQAIQMFLKNGGKRAFLGPLDGLKAIFDGKPGIGTTFINSSQLGLYS